MLKSNNQTRIRLRIRPPQSTKVTTRIRLRPPRRIKKEEEDEDTKNILNQQSADCTTKPSTIKVEKSLDLETKLISNRMLNENYCRICRKGYQNKSSLASHRRSIHPPPSKILYPDLKPDINSPNFYCCACDETFKNRYKYNIHLKNTHEIKPPNRNIVNPHLLPDKNDPNLYCCACEKTLANRHGFRKHLKNVHNMDIPFPGTTCIRILHPHLTPDINDPNFYCRACEKTLTGPRNFRYHLTRTHKIFPAHRGSVVRSPNKLPDINDPNQYCRVCEKKYSNTFTYYRHLRNIHEMTVQFHQVANPDISPDPDDPDFYCEPCEFKYKTRKTYHYHLESRHKLKLKRKKE